MDDLGANDDHLSKHGRYTYVGHAGKLADTSAHIPKIAKALRMKDVLVISLLAIVSKIFYAVVIRAVVRTARPYRTFAYGFQPGHRADELLAILGWMLFRSHERGAGHLRHWRRFLAGFLPSIPVADLFVHEVFGRAPRFGVDSTARHPRLEGKTCIRRVGLGRARSLLQGETGRHGCAQLLGGRHRILDWSFT